MKIIITESQLKTTVFQSAVDMAWEDIADNIKEEDYYDEGGYGHNYEAITKIDVVTAYKTDKVVELGIIIYIDTIFGTLDVGEYLWDLKLKLENYLGKNNFKFKLLNVINENPRTDW